MDMCLVETVSVRFVVTMLLSACHLAKAVAAAASTDRSAAGTSLQYQSCSACTAEYCCMTLIEMVMVCGTDLVWASPSHPILFHRQREMQQISQTPLRRRLAHAQYQKNIQNNVLGNLIRLLSTQRKAQRRRMPLSLLGGMDQPFQQSRAGRRMRTNQLSRWPVLHR